MRVDTSSYVQRLIRLALDEDLELGDVTTRYLEVYDKKITGHILAREELVVCGLELVAQVFQELGAEIEISSQSSEGALVPANTQMLRFQAKICATLQAERTVLNILQRMSGVATHTRNLVRQAGSLTLYDTRKTTPGWRTLEKYAVAVGGAKNHRFSLGDMILVKNNHVDAYPGGMRGLLEEITAKKDKELRFEVEVRNQEELSIALEFRPDAIMLDNFALSDIKPSVARIKGRSPDTLVEVSGGVNIDRFPELENLGIDYLSMGALTHQATAVDISLRIEKESR